jgi:hypothetical protein
MSGGQEVKESVSEFIDNLSLEMHDFAQIPMRSKYAWPTN